MNEKSESAKKALLEKIREAEIILDQANDSYGDLPASELASPEFDAIADRQWSIIQSLTYVLYAAWETLQERWFDQDPDSEEAGP